MLTNYLVSRKECVRSTQSYSHSYSHFSAYGDNKFANEFIQLSRWNIFNFPVFVLRFQKSFKQSYNSFSFLSGIFVFVF